MYLQPKRVYKNKQTGQESPNLADVVGDTVTVGKRFSVGVQRGWWSASPFVGIGCPRQEVPQEVREFEPLDGSLTYEEAVPLLFGTICDSIERSWQPDKFHVHLSSAGYDSRIISGAIRALVEKNGDGWLGRGLLFLSNRWEAREFETMMQAQGWAPEHYAAYTDGKAEDHFNRCLNFKRFWRTTNAPTPICGNLWWYLPDWAQEAGLIPGDDECQGYAGYWANETWDHLCRGGMGFWLRDQAKKYTHHAMATFPFKIPTMEFPLSDLNVMRILPAIKNGAGQKLREAVAAYASPETADMENPMTHDRKHPITQRAQQDCFKAYRGSWYRDNVERGWRAPTTSGFWNEWGQWGLASLCQHLVERGVDVKVG